MTTYEYIHATLTDTLDGEVNVPARINLAAISYYVGAGTGTVLWLLDGGDGVQVAEPPEYFDAITIPRRPKKNAPLSAPEPGTVTEVPR